MPGVRSKRWASSRSRKRIGAFSGLGAVAQAVLDRLGLAQGIRQCEAVRAWSEVVGEKIAEATEARAIRDGVLQVACRSNVWANELGLLKKDLLKRLSKAVGPGIVKDIWFFAARLPKKAGAAEAQDSSWTPDESDQSDADAAARAVRSVIKDAGLASAIDRAVRTAVLAEAEKRALGWRKCRKCGAMHDGDGELCVVCKVA